jgi:hypothetical protein
MHDHLRRKETSNIAHWRAMLSTQRSVKPKSPEPPRCATFGRSHAKEISSAPRGSHLAISRLEPESLPQPRLYGAGQRTTSHAGVGSARGHDASARVPKRSPTKGVASSRIAERSVVNRLHRGDRIVLARQDEVDPSFQLFRIDSSRNTQWECCRLLRRINMSLVPAEHVSQRRGHFRMTLPANVSPLYESFSRAFAKPP